MLRKHPSCVFNWHNFKWPNKELRQSINQKLTAIPYGDCWNWDRWNIEACCGLFAILCIEAEAGKRAAILVLHNKIIPQCNVNALFYRRNKSFVFGRTCYDRKSSISVRKNSLQFPRWLTRNQVKTDRQGRGVLKYFGFRASRNLQNWYCCCWCRRMKVALVCLIILYILREVRFGKIWTSSCFRVFRATI